MNFLRTMSIQRVVDLLKVKIAGEPMKTQSSLNLSGGRNIVFSQTEDRGETTLTMQAGAGGTLGWWGNFWDTTTQEITSTTTAYVVALNSSDPDNDGVMVVDGSKLTPMTPANYNICTSIQFTNGNAQAYDAVIWFRKNGTDLPDSASRITVPGTHGGINGHMVFYVSIAIHLDANDYVQLVWHAEDVSIKLETIAAGASPVYPRIPSVIASVFQV